MENSPFPSFPPKEESTAYNISEFYKLTPIIVVCLHAILYYDHIRSWEKPKEQRIILLLLLIAPIQAIISCYQVINPDTDTLFIILDSIKECYTTLIFPLFLSLLYSFLQLNDETLSSIYVRVIIGNRHITNFFPVTLIQPESVSINLDNLKFFEYSAWQYVVIRIVCSVLIIVLQLFGLYPVWLSWMFFVIFNLSFLLALYINYVFYQAFNDDFMLHVYYKYVFFRLIVFTCFFQGSVIKILKETGIIQASLHNFLVIGEMVLVSLHSGLAFSAIDYAPILPVKRPVCYQSSTYQVSEGLIASLR